MYRVYTDRVDAAFGYADTAQSRDKDFIERRVNFVQVLVAFNELEEARKLRRAFFDNTFEAGVQKSCINLRPELYALMVCRKKLHEKLGLGEVYAFHP